MRPIKVKQLNDELTPTAGLALVGHLLKSRAPTLADVEAALPVRAGVASSDIVRSYLGLLVQGKSETSTRSRTCAATSASSRRWASGCCRRARRCVSAWMRTRCRWPAT